MPDAPLQTILETQRLRLRPVGPADRDAVAALNQDPEVIRHIGACYTPAEIDAWYDKLQADYAAGRDTGWWLTETHAGEFVGLSALKRLSDTNLEHMGPLVASAEDDELLEIGWRFARAAWGNGYATEIGRALVDRAFSHHNVPRVNAVALAANVASCRAIQKCGLRFQAEYEIYNQPAHLFVLLREDYAARRRADELQKTGN